MSDHILRSSYHTLHLIRLCINNKRSYQGQVKIDPRNVFWILCVGWTLCAGG